MNDDAKQRIRKEEIKIEGTKNSIEFETEEHSVFIDGNILSSQRSKTKVAKGIVPHSPTDIVGECYHCKHFLTKEMLSTCSMCNQVICHPCARKIDKMSVCQPCLMLLKKHHNRQILRKIFVEPFFVWLK